MIQELFVDSTVYLGYDDLRKENALDYNIVIASVTRKEGPEYIREYECCKANVDSLCKSTIQLRYKALVFCVYCLLCGCMETVKHVCRST